MKMMFVYILEKLGIINFIFYKASIKLRDCGWKVFFHHVVVVLMGKVKNRQHKNKISSEDSYKLRDTHYIYNKKSEICTTVAFTIVSKNYMQYALVLRESFLLNNPCSEFYIVLVDMFRNEQEAKIFQDLLQKGVKVLGINEVRNAVPYFYLEAMLFKYNILEMNTAIKPFFLEYFCNIGYKNVMYIDPDICFFSSIENIVLKLEEYDIVLTPHALSPFPINNHPNDLDIVRAGTYNLGFIAIHNTSNSVNMCKWWQEKLFDLCVNDLHEGLFVDQKWMDLIPAIFDGVYIERSYAYNVAYWNLHERNVEKIENKWMVNDEILVFFHFSGMPIDDIHAISKHQNRYTLDDFPKMRELFEVYQKMVLDHGHDVFKQVCKEYYYGFIPETNVKIPDIVRYSSYREIFREICNPYLADAENIKRLSTLIYGGDFSKVHQAVYDSRIDLQKYFGNVVYGKGRKNFIKWFKTVGMKEYDIDPYMLKCNVVTDTDITTTGFGLNLVAYFKSISGTSVAARKFFKEFIATGIPFSTTVLPNNGVGEISKEEIQVFNLYHTYESKYKKTLHFINADNIKNIYNHYPQLFKDKYNAAVWWWEFDDYFYFDEAFEYVDEVVVMSEFIKKAVSKKIPQSVKLTKMTYPFMEDWQILSSKDETRKKYGFKSSDFLIFFNFDYHSSFERKNPLGLLKAFRLFVKNKSDAKLVLKTINRKSDMENEKKLRNYICEHDLEQQVILIDKDLLRDDMMTLLYSMDCYASLHRSEGFGLGMLEAMYLGIPVIGTGYGGNLDFMNGDNSFLVPYKMIENTCDFGPYKKGWLWADADIDAAAAYMEYIYDHKMDVAIKAKNTKEQVRRQYNRWRIQKEIFDFMVDREDG